MTADIIRRGGLDMQVCVPVDWTDKQVLEFAGCQNPCGTENGWLIRRQGHPGLAGDDERVPCAGQAGHVHIMLDA